MKIYDNEEYKVKEHQSVDEYLSFKAEEFKVGELIKNNFEEYKVKEIDQPSIEEDKTLTRKKIDDFSGKVERTKHLLNTGLQTTATLATVTVAAVGVGVVIPNLVNTSYYGSVDFVNYVVDINDELEENVNTKSVKIYFEEDLKDGYYCIVINKETKESKLLENNFVEFSNLISNRTDFEVVVMDDKKELSSFDINVILDEVEYLGEGQFTYIQSFNEDGTSNLYMNLEKEDLDLKDVIYLYDNKGNVLDYQSNDLDIDSVLDIVGDISIAKAVSYEVIDGNYYPVYQYHINNFEEVEFVSEMNGENLNLTFNKPICSDIEVQVKYLDNDEIKDFVVKKDEIVDSAISLPIDRITEIEVIVNGEFLIYENYQEFVDFKGKPYNYTSISEVIDVKQFNIIKLDHVEFLNTSYSYDGTIPTELYFSGTLLEDSYFEVNVYQNDQLIDSQSGITSFDNKVVFNDLDTTQNLVFEYILYQNDIEQSRNTYQSVSFNEEYLNADYEFFAINPGDVFITYNDDTYNVYIPVQFENNSDYEVVYKVELITEERIAYSYMGKDKVAEILNVLPNRFYSIVYKVFVKEGQNYYSIYNHYAMSGGIEIYQDENGIIYSGVDIIEITNGLYELSIVSQPYEDINVTAELSNGEIISFTFDKKDYELNTIDLTGYEFDSVKLTVKAKINSYYGMGDIVKELGVKYVGNEFYEFTVIFEF